jgi:hypothetical protein
VAAWLQRADQGGSFGSFFNPPLTPEERRIAAVEGWILGGVRTDKRRFQAIDECQEETNLDDGEELREGCLRNRF